MAREVKTMDFEVAVNHPAALFWQVYIKNFQVTMAAAMRGHFSQVEYEDGPPLAPGGHFRISYDEGFGHYDYVNFKWDEIDHEKFCFKSSCVHGGAIGNFEYLIYHFKLVPGSNANKCIAAWTIEYQDKKDHDFHNTLKEELIKLTKSIDTHIETQKKT